MNAEAPNSTVNLLLLVLAVLVLAAAVAGYNLLPAGTPDYVGMLLLLGGILVAALIGYWTAQGRAFFEFMRGANLERRKVVWPTRSETLQTTLIIGAVTAVAAIVLFVLDTVFSWGVKLLLGGF